MADPEKTQSTEQQVPKIATGDRAILPEGAKTIPVYIMGKLYEVPETLTIMKAMEFVGFKFIRGAGCRGGICGACSTVYRKAGDYKIYFGLACQTVVEPDMYLTQIPFYPANRASYNIEEIGATAISADCIQCGLCASRCMGELPIYHIAQLARRLYGKYLQPRAEHLKKRVGEIESGKYDQMLDDLTKMDKEQLEKQYTEREREPDMGIPGTWMPENTKYL
ncbi:MAG: 2Fe-2S iron-sulfur cluster binding domain-containing protein [Deltaproteobacteria bacterium]|nr:2Fe-2S iron-sulfur cluster binding domain-containing protein [Deltaproteobacteria bacterium]